MTVVVAKEALPAGGAIADNQLRTKRLDKGVVPPDAIRRSADVIGRRIQVAVEKGAVLRAANFAVFQTAVPDWKEYIPEGRVLYALNMTNRSLPLIGLKRGDSLDVVVAGTSSEDQTRIANVLVRDVRMVGYTRPNTDSPTADDSGPLGSKIAPPPAAGEDDSAESILMIAVLPKDVIRLAEADGTGLHLALVLHRPAEEGSDRLEVKNRERIQVIQGSGSKRVAR